MLLNCFRLVEEIPVGDLVMKEGSEGLKREGMVGVILDQLSNEWSPSFLRHIL